MTGPSSRILVFKDLCRALARGDTILSVLPKKVSTSLASAPPPLVLTDFAGRDSVAAAMAWLSEHPVGTLIPVGDVVPSRFGDWAVYEENWLRMRDQVERRHPNVRVAPWFALEDLEGWQLLNGRYIAEIVKAFGFYSPCPGCHLHFYAMRAVLARAMGAAVLVSGEKELHGRKRKANQSDEAVEAYRAFSQGFGLDHRFPIHKVTSEEEMLALLGEGWKEGERQLPCVFSGNDQGLDGERVAGGEQIRDFMERFALPVAREIVACRLDALGGSALRGRVEVAAREAFQRRYP